MARRTLKPSLRLAWEKRHIMALVIITWDLPPGERLTIYNEKVQTEWLRSVLQQPGVTQVRAYRNPHYTTPQVMVHLEFTSLTAWQAYLASESYAELMFDLRAVGCTHLAIQVWDASQLVPEPVTPPSS
jgi:hypothetical protein